MQCKCAHVDRSLTPSFVSPNPMRNVHSLAVLLLLFLAPGVLCNATEDRAMNASAATTIRINPTVGPPTTALLVSGSGFDPSAEVNIYFDAAILAMVTTNGTGSFGGGSRGSGVPVQVPASAIPGTHLVRAVERPATRWLRRDSWFVQIGHGSVSH